MQKHNEARRFITLIDVLYEARVRWVNKRPWGPLPLRVLVD
jgi:predicted ATPase